MPKLGAAMENGTILKWFKSEGEQVSKGEPLLEIMTDKISMELEAESNGFLLKVCCEADEVVPVHQVIGYIGKAGEDLSELSQKYEVTHMNHGEKNKETASSLALSDTAEFEKSAGKPRRTPAARRMAESQGIDLRLVKGTGINGRIHRKNVESYIEENRIEIKATPLARKIAAESQIQLTEIHGSGVNGKIVRDDVLRKKEQELLQPEARPVSTERIKIDGIRKIIAQKMVQSITSAAHITLVSEVDMSRSKVLRKELLPIIEKKNGLRLSFTEILMKFVAHTLRKHPMLYASIDDEYIVLNQQVNIGLAVSVPEGLLVPVVRDADQKGLATLTEECKHLALSAREGKLKPDQMTGANFTISNLGMYAVDAFTPIINPPGLAILGVGRIQEKAVAVEGSIEIRPMMSLSLSVDHRIIDGAPAAAFLTDLKEILENPYYGMV